MLLFLVLVLVVVPLVELFVIVRVGDWIGYLPTFALLIGISICGGYLVKREGIETLRRAQAQLRAGEIPAAELVDGAIIVTAGALLLTPGFVTDAIGLLFLFPPTRFFPRRWARNRRTVRTGNVVYGRIIDVRGTGGPPPGRPDEVPPRELPPPD